MIRRLKHNQIDKLRWDEVVYNADTPHIYGLSWYLDVVSPGWEALVWDNYKWIMPLPVKYKWGVPYLVQPMFCQKTSIYGIGVKSSDARLFYKKLFWNYLYFNLTLNDTLGLENRKYLNARINYTLDLTPAYYALKKDYKENTLRNIKKALNKNLTSTECPLEDFIIFCKPNLKGLTHEGFLLFKNLTETASKHKVAQLRMVTDPGGEILCAACFLVWNSRIVYLAGASSQAGEQKSAMFLLFDRVISEYAGTGYLMDFEGSMIPGVARFFRGFGAKSHAYYHLKKYLFFYR